MQSIDGETIDWRLIDGATSEILFARKNEMTNLEFKGSVVELSKGEVGGWAGFFIN